MTERFGIPAPVIISPCVPPVVVVMILWVVEVLVVVSKGRGLEYSASIVIPEAFVCLRLRQNKNMTNPMARTRARPPIAPPTIAPILFLEDDEGLRA